MSNIKVKDSDNAVQHYANLGTGTSTDPFHSIPADFYLEVAKGNVNKHSAVNKFGRNTEIDTTTLPEDIWDAGGEWVAPTIARIHDIASTSTNDSSLDKGMRTVNIQGLDANFDLQSETVVLNGTTNVPTVNSYTRIFRMYGETFGSDSTNLGDITATAQTDATVTAQITTGKGQTLMAIYTIPNGKTGYVTQGFCSMNRAGATSGAMIGLAFEFRADADQSDSGWRVAWEGALSVEGSSFINLSYMPIPPFPAKTDLRVRVHYASDNDSDVAAGFDIILVDD